MLLQSLIYFLNETSTTMQIQIRITIYFLPLENAKNKHIPKKLQRFNRRKHFIEPWMKKNLLALVNKKNDKYRDWKSTNNDIEYEIKKY